MNNALADIVRCDIDISNPPSADASFDTILLVVRAPEVAGTETLSTVTQIKSAAGLLEYGYKEDSEAYKAATVAFSQTPSPGKVLITVRNRTSEAGVTPEVFEDIATTLDRAIDEKDFYGIHLTEFRATEDFVNAAEWAEENAKLLAYEFTEYAGNPITAKTYYRTFGMYAGNAVDYPTDKQPEKNKYMALAEMAKCFGYEPGSETWHLKELAGMTPSALGEARKTSLQDANVTMYLQYANKNVTIGGKVLAGEWIDVIRFRDWLKTDMQLNVFTALQANRKVPFTDKGIALIENAITKTLLAGQRIGGIPEDEFDENGVLMPAFTVTVPKSMNLTAEERKSRILTGCTFTAKLAGAIHAVEITGSLTN